MATKKETKPADNAAENTAQGAGTNAKEPEQTPKPTVGKKAAETVGKELLKNNPTLKEVYVTADGRGFYQQSDAANHARTLKDTTVTEVKK